MLRISWSFSTYWHALPTSTHVLDLVMGKAADLASQHETHEKQSLLSMHGLDGVAILYLL